VSACIIADLVIISVVCRMFELGRPARFEELHATLCRFFDIADDVTCYALHGDDVCSFHF